MRFHFRFQSFFRKLWWQVQGAYFGDGTIIPRMAMNWPHQVFIGKHCVLEDDIFFKYASYWQPGPSVVIYDRVFIGRNCEFNIQKHIDIGSDCLIASGCKFIDHDHELTVGEGPIHSLTCPEAPIMLEEDVWLGVNVTVLKGVIIGRGAVVGAGAVVTKSIPAYEIWAGIPARKIGQRDKH